MVRYPTHAFVELKRKKFQSIFVKIYYTLQEKLPFQTTSHYIPH